MSLLILIGRGLDLRGSGRKIRHSSRGQLFTVQFSGCWSETIDSLIENSGGNGERVPPVPIPNTEVKPLSADGTWLETARESRTPPDPISRKRAEQVLFLESFQSAKSTEKERQKQEPQRRQSGNKEETKQSRIRQREGRETHAQNQGQSLLLLLLPYSSVAQWQSTRLLTELL